MLAVICLADGCARVPQRPSASFFTPVPAPGAKLYHTVLRGQTLYRIAKNYQVDVSDLMRVNHIYNPTQLEPGQQLLIPQKVTTRVVRSFEPLSLEQIRSLVGPRNTAFVWKTITLHHSATLKGNARLFDRDHRRRRMGGLFYHFVIGNGSYTGNGAIEVGWRWKRQVKANRPYDIQICLVGNFNQQQVSEAQMSTLIHLIRVLQEQYGISTGNIRKHEDIKGKHTECPGKNFPFQKLLTRLSTGA